MGHIIAVMLYRGPAPVGSRDSLRRTVSAIKGIASVERIRGLIIIDLRGKLIYPHTPITLARRKSRDKRREKETRKDDTGRLSLVSRVCSFISSRGFYTISCT